MEINLSVADFIRALSLRDPKEFLAVWQPLLQAHLSSRSTLVRKYVGAEPSLDSALKVLPRLLQSNDHVYMSNVITLLGYALKELSVMDSSAASRVSNVIIVEHLRVLFRCLSSGDASCWGATLHLLALICRNDPAAVVENMDWSHKGFMMVAKSTKSLSHLGLPSPRHLFIDMFINLIQYGNFESRVLLSHNAFIFHYIVTDLLYDDPETIGRLLLAVQERLVLNEENNHNLPVAFLKGQLPKLVKLLQSKNHSIKRITGRFLEECFVHPGRGLCYPVDNWNSKTLKNISTLENTNTSKSTKPLENTNTLKNKLLLDLANLLDPLDDEFQQSLLLKCLENGPDAAWAYLGAGNKIKLDPNPSLEFVKSVNLAILIIGQLSMAKDLSQILPSRLSRSNLVRGVTSQNVIIRLNSLLLLLALVRRIDPVVKNASTLLPDFKTIYDAWKANPIDTVEDNEEELYCMICFLQLMAQYLQSDLTNQYIAIEMFSSLDFAGYHVSEELAQAACVLLNQISPLVLGRNGGLKNLEELVIKAGSAGLQLLTTWFRQLQFFDEQTKVKSDLDKDELGELLIILNGLVTGEQVTSLPIIATKFSQKTCIMDVSPESTIPSLLPMPECDEAIVPQSTTLQLNLNEIEYDDVVDLLTELLPRLRRSIMLQSYSSFSHYGFDFITWLRLLAAAFTNPKSTELDLRRVIDVGLLGFPIVALSSNQLDQRKLAHLILNRAMSCLENSLMKERRQIILVLQALSNLISPERPLAKISRLIAVFHALAILVMLRPENPMYRPLNELFLTSPIISPIDAYNKLMNDTNEEWARYLYWCLTWIDITLGKEGEFVTELNEELRHLHVAENSAILLQSNGLDGGCKNLLSSILVKLARIDSEPHWISNFLEFIEQ